MARARTSATGSQGFTLVELLVVLLILGLTLGLVLPSAPSVTAGAGLHAASRQVAASLREARGAALVSGRVVGFAADAGAGTYGYGAIRRRLPWGVAMAAGVPSGGGPIAFYPEGGSTGGFVRLVAGAGERVVVVDALTGRVREEP